MLTMTVKYVECIYDHCGSKGSMQFTLRQQSFSTERLQYVVSEEAGYRDFLDGGAGRRERPNF